MTAIADRPVQPPLPAGSDPGARREFSYQPALDGLRAVAVLSVLAYHFGAGWADGGFLGVDMFFVLSGYLITSLLLIERSRTGTIRFGAFWARRARRLLPAIFLVLIAVAIWVRIELPADQWRAFRADSLWTFFYGANWHLIDAGQSYFSADASPLRHAWSLAIEEQFYLVWPLIVYGSLRVTRGKHWLLTGICVAGIGASFYALTSHFHEGRDPSRAYYGTDARASQLLVGALLALLLFHWKPVAPAVRVALQWLAVAAALAIAYVFVATDDRASMLYRGGFLGFAVCTAIVIAAVVQPTRNPLRVGLSLSPVRWVGQVSYGVYLWHWPIAVALNPVRTGLNGWQLGALRTGATFAIATLSFYLVERPIRQRRFRHVWTPRVALPAAAALTIGVVLIATAGATAPNPLAGRPGTVLTNDPPAVATPITPATDTPTQRTLLLGDSVAFTLTDALRTELANRGVDFRNVTRLGCGMTDGLALTEEGDVVEWSPRCATSTVAYIDNAIAQANPDTVLWLSTWELSSYQVNGMKLTFGTKAFDQWLTAQIERTRARAAAAGARLVLVQIPPQAENPISTPAPYQAARTQHLNTLFEEFAAAHPTDVALVDMAEIVCPGGAPCPTVVDGIVLRPKDGGHYEPDGAAWLAPRLTEELFTALRTLDGVRAEAATAAATATTTTTTARRAPRAGR